jgi:hypothetical protein
VRRRRLADCNFSRAACVHHKENSSFFTIHTILNGYLCLLSIFQQTTSMARLSKSKRILRKQEILSQPQETLPSPALTGAEMFEALAYEANEIRFNGPAFATQAAVPPDAIKRSLSVVSDGFSIGEHRVEEKLEALSLFSNFATVAYMNFGKSFPGPAPEPFNIEGHLDAEIVSPYGNFNTGSSGLSLSYIDPASHVKAFSWLASRTPDVPMSQLIDSSWLPVVPNDARTRLIIATKLWLSLDPEKNEVPLSLVYSSLFSTAPAHLMAGLRAAHAHEGWLQPEFWSGYRTSDAFKRKLESRGFRQALAHVGLVSSPLMESSLVITETFSHVIDCANRVVSDARLSHHHLLKRLPVNYEVNPSSEQVLHFRNGKVYGPVGVHVPIDGCSEYEKNLKVSLLNSECYTNELCDEDDLYHTSDSDTEQSS